MKTHVRLNRTVTPSAPHAPDWLLLASICVGWALAAFPAPLLAQPAPGEKPEGKASPLREVPMIEVEDLPVPIPRQIQRRADNALMRLVPAGEFFRGSNDPASSGGDPDEAPMRSIYLNSYYIDQYEVTNAQYQLYLQATKKIPPPFFSVPGFIGDDKPVVGLTWDEANEYARFVGGRLPTEAEWEKAARGVEARLYPWGNELEGDEANTSLSDEYPSTSPVGAYPEDVSPYGVHDLGGNVSEWVSDWYSEDYYAASETKNPRGPEIPTGRRVLRGGSYDFDPDKARTISRIPEFGNERRSTYGFRVVVVPGGVSRQDEERISFDSQQTERRLEDTPEEELWASFEKVFLPLFEQHRTIPSTMAADIPQLFPASPRRDVNLINLSDATMYIALVTEKREVVLYDRAVRQNSALTLRLPMEVPFRVYAIYQDEKPEVEKIGILNVPRGTDPYYIVSDLAGRFKENSPKLKMADPTVNAPKRELALVNRTENEILFTLSDMTDDSFPVVLDAKVAPKTYEVLTIDPGEYRAVARYELKPTEFALTEIFQFDADTIRQTIDATPLPGGAEQFGAFVVRRSVYVP